MLTTEPTDGWAGLTFTSEPVFASVDPLQPSYRCSVSYFSYIFSDSVSSQRCFSQNNPLLMGLDKVNLTMYHFTEQDMSTTMTKRVIIPWVPNLVHTFFSGSSSNPRGQWLAHTTHRTCQVSALVCIWLRKFLFALTMLSL